MNLFRKPLGYAISQVPINLDVLRIASSFLLWEEICFSSQVSLALLKIE